jgi:hypothetical protein
MIDREPEANVRFRPEAVIRQQACSKDSGIGCVSGVAEIRLARDRSRLAEAKVALDRSRNQFDVHVNS